ncbi:3-oxoacyl-(acyl-carrier-protein) reductase [Bosea sp. 62]|uniref:SDR family NAD(P)-dependent oxidoreductase n=1 Tax=unclassified Bosea (in: a-proteobacteria) TaxID=2653178 RepID=UPI0012591FA5|nr:MULTISPECIES: SDR family oxidoreductase [unclassified Bosea (in: a-proteobacteria)]CAD5288914.1 3-oxoacyl-(acyl-carrier-protein) reductase [Bosea sp. 21B]CAD5291261.1 3-oxoacyl-(acyl-carrier-protein) reductase [Bosea sp. 46]CAD5300737.1 3-oxoacyl-(acyl-carrier-protein) reductase [Bosea sp. 7B]VVT60296.1 3-oxoacyl-(acyl-carrier-protein) reductase [Bosea sp. EC-HK365B]VXA94696.1 3-oxoacyl-(acyl-carrier-protein) reductase [Bosea sp. 62]
MLDDLKGLRALVTGSSTGIGAAVAKAYAANGMRVVVHYKSSEAEANAVAAQIRAAGGEAHVLQADVADSAQAVDLVNKAADKLGGLDVLVNNAGALVKRTPIAEIEDEFFDSVVDLNVRSVVMASKAALPYLKKSGGRASVINLSSIAARNGGGPGSSLYASSKAFVLNLTRGMAKEFVPFGIRVNGVSPGVIMTPFHERYSTAEQIEAMRKTVPMERVGTPQDNVGVFLFLASPAMSGYITGQTIEVNGGQYMV